MTLALEREAELFSELKMYVSFDFDLTEDVAATGQVIFSGGNIAARVKITGGKDKDLDALCEVARECVLEFVKEDTGMRLVENEIDWDMR